MVHGPSRAFEGPLLVVSLAVSAALASGCGPSYLTPDLVREHLDAPKGQISSDTMPRAARGFFKAKTAQAAEATAFFVKSSSASEDGAAGWAQGVVAQGVMEEAVAQGGAESVADILCAASLVANISEFDACQIGENCEVDLTIDACVLRIGEGGDDRARGSIRFKLKNSTTDEFDRTELRLTFDAFETTDADDDAAIRFLGGVIALEQTTYKTEVKHEVIFSADVDLQKKKANPGFFENPLLERLRATAALRFAGEVGEDSARGSLEILAFLDENDDAREQSIALVLEAESHEISPEQELAQATLQVRGSNGNFTCTWDAASQELGPEQARYESEGECVDDDSGETFTFASVVEDR